MVQLIVSQSCCSKAAKSFTHHVLSCRARDLEFWVVPVPFDQRKFEPVIFVEWKAPRVHSKRIPKFSKTFPGTFTVPFSFTPEISEFLVEWKAPVLFVFPNFFSTNQEGANFFLFLPRFSRLRTHSFGRHLRWPTTVTAKYNSSRAAVVQVRGVGFHQGFTFDKT